MHLQCHFGLETLSWARRGASVVGLDFSQPAVETANALAAETGLDGSFVAADVYDAPAVLDGRKFEIVYTGLGAINWLPDLERWAGVVRELVAPGGFLYLAEFHPFTDVFGDEDLKVVNDYFGPPEGRQIEDEGGTYANLAAKTVHNVTHEWWHSLGEVLDAVLGAGLRLELFSEHDYTLFARWPFLEPDRETPETGEIYRQPAGSPRLPLMFSMRARLD